MELRLQLPGHGRQNGRGGVLAVQRGCWGLSGWWDGVGWDGVGSRGVYSVVELHAVGHFGCC